MDLLWIATILFGALVIYSVYWLMTQDYYYWEKRGIPRINVDCKFSSMIQFLLGNVEHFDGVNEIYKLLEGKRFGGFLQFNTPSIMIRDPELVQTILTKDFLYFENRLPVVKNHSDIASLGLPNLSGEDWKIARHKLTSTFSSGKLKMVFEPIKEKADNLVSFLENKTNLDLDVKDLILKVILSVVADVGFGLNVNALNETPQSKEFLEATSKFFKPSIKTFFKIIFSIYFPNIFKMFKLQLIDKEVSEFFLKLTRDSIQYRITTGTRRNDFLQLMIDQKKKEQDNLNSKNVTNDNNIENKKGSDELKHIPASHNKLSNSVEMFTDEFMTAQTFLFISSGSENVSTALTFVLFELAMNQDCQRKVYQEIHEVFTKNEFNYHNVLKKMIYMDQFIHETLRVHPTLAVLTRVCTRDYKIPDSDAYIDKDTLVNIPVIGFHNDPQYFPDPEKFIPDRFQDMDAIPKGVYFTFGEGPRMCIAMNLALLEMKTFLIILLTTYTVNLSKKTKLPLKKIRNSIVGDIEGGIWVKFEKRN